MVDSSGKFSSTLNYYWAVLGSIFCMLDFEVFSISSLSPYLNLGESGVSFMRGLVFLGIFLGDLLVLDLSKFEIFPSWVIYSLG